MPVGDRTVAIPSEVQTAVGDSLAVDDLLKWWDKPHVLLQNDTPHHLWDQGKKNDVFAFIEAAQSGDMA